MLKAIIPKNEKERLETLKSYKVLDTLQEKVFDEITKTASLVCECKTALISLVDSERQWFKSKVGLSADETPRDISFCGHAIMSDDIFEIPDTHKDERFSDNPLVTGKPYIRFYAGAPLIAPNGQRIGTLCVINPEPKALTENQKEILKTLSRQIIDLLELRIKNLEITNAAKIKTSILSEMVEGVIIQNSEGKIIEFNQSALNILGMTEEQLFGRDSMDPRWSSIRFDGSPYPGEEHPSMVALATGEKVINSIMGVDNPQKGLRWIRINSLPLEFDEEKLVYTTFEDVTSFIERSSEIESYVKGIDRHTIVAKTDRKGTITYVNDKFCEISGYTRDELIGKNHRILNSGYHPKSFFENLWKTINQGKIWKGEILNQAKSGKYYWVNTTISPLLDYNGDVKEFIAFRYDITEKKNAEIDLKNSENKLRQLFTQSRDAQMTLEPPNWNFTSGNPEALRLFNVKSEEDFVQLGPWDVAPKRQPDGMLSSEKAQELIKQTMTDGSQCVEWMHSTIDGKNIPCSVLLSRIDDSENSYIHAIVRDISEQKRLEKQLLETNEYMKFALDGAGLGVWDWNLLDNTVVFDERCINMLGYELSELEMTLELWEERVHPEDKDQVNRDIKAYLDGETDHYENIHRLKHKNGEWVYILDLGKVSERDENGKPIRFTGTHLDITESQKSQDQKLDEFREILSATPSCLKVMTKEGLLLDMNKQGLELIEAPSLESVYKKNVYDLVDEEYRDKFIEFNEKVCSGHKGNLVFKVIGLQGTSRWMETYAAPIKLSNGETAHIAITNDISEKIHAEEEYNKQKAIAQHQAKLASIGELAAGVGHEINNPLAIIKGYVTNIEKRLKKNNDIDKNSLDNYLTKILNATDRIEKIVLGLRTFSRTDSNEKESFSPSEAIKESINMINEIYENDGIKLEFENELKENDPWIQGSRGKFQQVIMNLFSNAKDALADFSKKRININIKCIKDNVVVQVQDNGHGIPDNIKSKILDPFFTTKDVNKGTGIGLSLANTFIQEMDGKLTIESQVGKGSTFTISFPVKETREIERTVESNRLNNEQHTLQGHVLLVDDEEEILELIKTTLIGFGLDVTTAQNGAEALQTFKKEPEKYNYIISDMQMPIMDGPTLLKEIRASQGGVQPKFIFFTGGINIDLENDELNKMFDGYFLKPFTEKSIYETLASCTSKKEENAA